MSFFSKLMGSLRSGNLGARAADSVSSAFGRPLQPHELQHLLDFVTLYPVPKGMTEQDIAISYLIYLLGHGEDLPGISRPTWDGAKRETKLIIIDNVLNDINNGLLRSSIYSEPVLRGMFFKQRRNVPEDDTERKSPHTESTANLNTNSQEASNGRDSKTKITSDDNVGKTPPKESLASSETHTGSVNQTAKSAQPKLPVNFHKKMFNDHYVTCSSCGRIHLSSYPHSCGEGEVRKLERDEENKVKKAEPDKSGSFELCASCENRYFKKAGADTICCEACRQRLYKERSNTTLSLCDRCKRSFTPVDNETTCQVCESHSKYKESIARDSKPVSKSVPIDKPKSFAVVETTCENCSVRFTTVESKAQRLCPKCRGNQT